MGKILHCPKCTNEIATFIENSEYFKVRYEPTPRKLDDQLFKLPVKTYCADCKNQISLAEPVTEQVSCVCAKGQARYIALPHQTKKEFGDWTYIHLPAVLRSVDCADAVVKCFTPNCDTYMRLTEFMATGRAATFADRQNSLVTFDDDGNLVINHVDALPPM